MLTRRHHSGMSEAREMLWLETDVICTACSCLWCAIRAVGTDVNHLQCPECGDYRSELAHEHNTRRVYH